jgi:hypothetical protein
MQKVAETSGAARQGDSRGFYEYTRGMPGYSERKRKKETFQETDARVVVTRR